MHTFATHATFARGIALRQREAVVFAFQRVLQAGRGAAQAHAFAQAVNFNSYATAMAALTWPHLLNAKAGETLLVHGAAGGVGSMVARWAKALGATVIATAGSAAKAATVQAHGVDHVLLSDDPSLASNNVFLVVVMLIGPRL